MNKLHIFGMMALAVAGLTSCEPDDSPVIQEPTEFVLNTPPFATQLYQLTAGHTIEFTCSQPNYGLTLAPAYSLEVSIHPDFGASLDPIDPQDEDAVPYSVVIVPDNPYNTVINVKDQDVSNAILAMRGITEEAQYTQATQPLYVRAIASINNQAITTIVSTKIITLAQVQDYMSLESSLPVLYVPGNANGWNQEASMQLLGYEQDAATGEWVKYRGLTYLDGGFKFTVKPNWDGPNYGYKSEGQLDTDGGADNLPLPDGEGLYWMEVDLKAMTYSAEKVTSFGLAGDFNGWNAGAPAEFTEHSADFKIWTYTGELAAGGYKIIVNGPSHSNPWAVNYGGPADEVTFDGANLPSTDGTHTVVLDLSVLPYTVTYQ